MQANWSLILNVLLLIGVVVAIARLMKARRHSLLPAKQEPSLGHKEMRYDDIIAVRKINYDLPEESCQEEAPLLDPIEDDEPQSGTDSALCEKTDSDEVVKPGKSIMMFLLAKEGRQLAGYELLQTVLAAGLRFGEGSLFHRHQHANGQGPVLCSLAAATASGVFDLQNIGAFRVRGLCLFMHASGNPTIDAERFAIMHDTAKQLSEGLDTYLLDEQRKPISEKSLTHYKQLLSIHNEAFSMA
ncbi:MAG: cell division protein ZipA C-terminal FtsZ-binding domain-containing protein [Tatlockia sp.]|jgi:cell division protein ZipA